MSKQSQIDKITELKDQAGDKFAIALTASEKHIFDEAVTLIHELETTPDGKIKASVTNLKRLAQIRTKLAKAASNPEYQKAVKGLVGEFDKIYNAQVRYFASLTEKMHHEDKYKLMKQIAVENTINGLAGAGLQNNVTDKLNDMLLRAVTSGAKYADLVDEMRTYLRGDAEHPGALTRYAGTYTITALSQYAGQNNKILTEDLGCEWFEYVGSEIETTREFCEHLTEKRWVHKSEIPELLKGHIDGHKCKIYAKTGLPYGMIEGTNAENFQVNVGGWNCRHQLVPIAKEMVPPEIRARFEKPKQQPQQEASKDWEEFMADQHYGAASRRLADWKDKVFPELVLGALQDRTAKRQAIMDAYHRASSQFYALTQQHTNTQMQLQRAINKAKREGALQLAELGEKALESNKLLTTPNGKAEYQQRVDNMKSAILQIKKGLEAKPAQKTTSPKATQKKEVSMESLGITRNTPPKELIEKQLKYIEEALQVDEKDAKRYEDALDRYTGNYYSEIRAVQAGDIEDERYAKIANSLEEFIDKAPKWAGGATYRGIGLWFEKDIERFRTAQATRMPIEMYGAASWSTDKGTAKYFAERDGDIQVVFICKGGQPQGTSVAGLSRIPNEHEVVTSKKARWVIVDIRQPSKKEKTYYEIEVKPC